MKFSIIIPIYNAERHLHACLDSILSQDFKDYEVLLIDDGSNDNSPNICDKISSENIKFSTIHKENSGASDCRNIGILNAKGEYILFLDSDDTFTPNILSTIDDIIKCKQELHLYVGKFNYLIDDKLVSKNQYNFDSDKLSNKNSYEILSYLFSEIPEQTWSIWRNVYNRAYILNNNLFFNKDLVIGEDLDYFIRAVLSTNKIGCVNKPIVNYRLSREDSLTANLNIRKIKDIIYICRYWIQYLENTSCSNVAKQLIYDRLVFSFAALFLHYNRLDIKSKRELKLLIKENEDMFKYSKKHNIKLISISYKALGVGATSRLVKLWTKIN